MASSGNPNNPPPPQQTQFPLDLHQFYHPTTIPSSSYPPPTLPFPFQNHHLQPHPPQPPQLQHPSPLHQQQPPSLPLLQQQQQQQPQFHPISALLSQRSVPFPTPPHPPNSNPNFVAPNLTPGPNSSPTSNASPNAGARLMALLGSLPQPIPTSSSGEFSGSGAPADPLPLAPARMVSSKMPQGRRLTGDYVACDVDAKDPSRPPPQLEVTPITKYISDPQLVLGRQIAVNQSYICYGLKQGNIRILNINTASRSLLRGHTQKMTDMAFFAEDVHLLASASTDGRICVWKVSEGPEEEKQQISGDAVIAIQIMGEQVSIHPLVCWHCHKQEVLVIGIGNRVLRIDTTKVGKGGVFSAEEPLKCPVDSLIDGVQLVGKHEGEITDLSMCQWMTSRLASASVDGLIKIWEDRKSTPLAVFRPHDGQPVNSAKFITCPDRPDHIVLMTAGPINREVKIWCSDSDEGWLLPNECESWKCTQILDLKSSAEPRFDDAFFNQVLVLPRAGLLLLANAKKNAIYAVHLEYGPDPASTRMDYLSEFTVTMPILSFTGISDESPYGEHIIQVYCVQTQAIQQYALDLFLCLPPSAENVGLQKSGSNVSFAASNNDVSIAADFIASGSVPKTTEKTSGNDTTEARTTAVAIPSNIPLDVESQTVAMAVPSPEVDIRAVALPPPLSLSPRLSGKLSDLKSYTVGSESNLPSHYHASDQAATSVSIDRQVDAVSENFSHGPSLNDGVRDEEKRISQDNSPTIVSPAVVFKHPTHLITPSEILRATSSTETSKVSGSMNEGDRDVKTFDDVVNSEVSSATEEVKVVADVESVGRDEPSQNGGSPEPIADNRERVFCSQVSDLGMGVAREFRAMSSASLEDTQPRENGRSSELLLQVLSADDERNNESSKYICENVSESAATGISTQGPLPNMKNKKQKGKSSQVLDLTSPSPSAYNSTDSSNEAGGNSNFPSSESVFPQFLSMQETLNQVLNLQKEMKKQMVATVNVPIVKEGKRLETALSRSLEKTVKANTDALWARFQEESAKNERLIQEQGQHITNSLNNFINKDLPALVEKIVKKEVVALQTAVLRAIAPAMEKSISAGIMESFQKGVGDKAVNLLEKSVNSKLEAIVARQIQAQFQTSGRQTLQDTLKSSLESSVIPAFEKSCKAMFEQVDTTFHRGLIEHTSAVQQQMESLHSPLAVALRDAMNSASTITRTLSGDITEAQRKLLALVAAGSSLINPSIIQPSNGPLSVLLEKADTHVDPTKELLRLIMEFKYEEAFTTALQRSDVSIVSWLCTQVDLHRIVSMAPLPLSQGVLLSLLQQLSCDINNDTPRKLAWMTDISGTINTTDPVISMHVRPIFEQVYQILNHQRNLPTNSSAEVSSIRLLMHVINSMLMTCK
ncbi:hypothetical protein MLD38_034276 [Melastoma candidum]|uniref:Uncharacterized protein n=1 Tax=Melastoma candidum TaxID=119954 RepID=A0ACB9MB93_9MYRT|nr:hypothetical protein MLD38_034276 [Melastoma candidum]